MTAGMLIKHTALPRACSCTGSAREPTHRGELRPFRAWCPFGITGSAGDTQVCAVSSAGTSTGRVKGTGGGQEKLL